MSRIFREQSQLMSQHAQALDSLWDTSNNRRMHVDEPTTDTHVFNSALAIATMTTSSHHPEESITHHHANNHHHHETSSLMLKTRATTTTTFIDETCKKNSSSHVESQSSQSSSLIAASENKTNKNHNHDEMQSTPDKHTIITESISTKEIKELGQKIKTLREGMHDPNHDFAGNGPNNDLVGNGPALLLQNVPTSVPSFDTKLPKSLVILVQQHSSLICYHDADKHSWSDALRLGFSKRKYLYEKVKEKAINGDILAAAARCDVERGELSLDKYMKALKGSDPTKKSRTKRLLDEI